MKQEGKRILEGEEILRKKKAAVRNLPFVFPAGVRQSFTGSCRGLAVLSDCSLAHGKDEKRGEKYANKRLNRVQKSLNVK